MIRRLALLGVLAGCEPLVDPGYPGEPMARLHGTIVGVDPERVADSVAILWNRNVGPSVPSGPIALAPLHPAFPAALTIDVLAAPPDDAFFAVAGDTARIAEGYLYLVRAGAEPPIETRDFSATAVDFVLVYVDGDVAPGSLTADYLGGVLAPGYHLRDWRATLDLSPAQAYFGARCADAVSDAGAVDGQVEACRAKRRYRLVDAAADLGTEMVFYPTNGGP
jgi:hypothetical protein